MLLKTLHSARMFFVAFDDMQSGRKSEKANRK